MASEMNEGDDYNISDQDEKEENDSHPLGNPAPPPDVDLELLRGDRIGDTVYSGKWCIETVMKMMKSNVVMKEQGDDSGGNASDKPELVDMDEDLQNQVGVLWDMTGNEEVCVYLQSVGAVESICFIIAKSRCPRATEMCAGMLANIITHDVMWKSLHNDSTLYSILIPLLANQDQPSLLEITRFFNTALCHTENSHCYASLYESSGLVLQELARILSGSTNGELLKHTAEMVHSLLELDSEDNKFCTVFAEQDFIIACVEASKEIGYDHVTTGQNHLMDIFYRFTTYEAGIAALELCLEPIAEACSSYLTHLCQNLSLSNNCTTMTTTLFTLNHVFCRHSRVQQAILSAPRLFGYILKVLITVYTRLGLYNSISSSEGDSRTKSTEEKERWTDLDDTPGKSETGEAGSWSERAIAASGALSNAPTPDASPMTRHDRKELDISWSERRVGTPLANQYIEEVWKMPKGTKKVPKKPLVSQDSDAKDADVSMEEPASETSKKADDEEEEGSVEKVEDEEKRFGGGKVEENEEEDSVTAKKIEPRNRSDGISSRKSEGFLPQEENESEKRLLVDDDRDLNSDPKEEKSVVDSPEDTGNGDGGRSKDSRPVGKTTFDDSSEEEDELSSNKKDGDGPLNSFEAVADNLTTGDDKYHTLLNAIREFFTDVINSFKESDEDAPSNPPIRDLMRYLDRRCNRTEIRALVKCLSSESTSSGTVEKLLALCELFGTSRVTGVACRFLRKRNGRGKDQSSVH